MLLKDCKALKIHNLEKCRYVSNNSDIRELFLVIIKAMVYAIFAGGNSQSPDVFSQAGKACFPTRLFVS